jgi:phospholipid-binding lipoprotein MlaA
VSAAILSIALTLVGAPSAGDVTSLPKPGEETQMPVVQADPPPTPEPAPKAEPAQSESATATDIVVTARPRASKADPAAAINIVTFDAAQVMDRALVAPVTKGYTKIVPKPARDGLHNLINNLDEPIVFVNFLLQLKPGKAAATLGRFAINSTVGVGGLIDVAKRKPFRLPRRSNGLADTLGYYGVKPGPYLFLPLIGATTLRDMLGRVVDLSILPTAFGKPFTNPAFSTSKGALSAVDERAHVDEDARRERHESADPYTAVREDYLRRRQAEIDVLKGKSQPNAEPEPK